MPEKKKIPENYILLKLALICLTVSFDITSVLFNHFCNCMMPMKVVLFDAVILFAVFLNVYQYLYRTAQRVFYQHTSLSLQALLVNVVWGGI